MVAAIAGLVAATLARLIGEVDIFAAFLIGQLVFMIFGVLLGSGGVELTAPDHGDDATGHH